MATQLAQRWGRVSELELELELQTRYLIVPDTSKSRYVSKVTRLCRERVVENCWRVGRIWFSSKQAAKVSGVLSEKCAST